MPAGPSSPGKSRRLANRPERQTAGVPGSPGRRCGGRPGIASSLLRQPPFEGLGHLLRHVFLDRGQVVELLPEGGPDRGARPAPCPATGVPLGQHEGACRRLAKPSSYPFGNGLTGVFERSIARWSAFVRQDGAGGQPHQVVRIRHRTGLVEVVDAPDQPAFRVPPGAEVLDVEIGHASTAGAVARSGQTSGQRWTQR